MPAQSSKTSGVRSWAISQQVFLVTGCAGGVGGYLAGELAAAAKGVIATDIRHGDLEQRAAERKWPTQNLMLAALDVTDDQQWEDVVARAIERFGQIDVFLNVAGYLHPGWSHETASKEVHRHLDINAKGVIFGTQVALRHLLPRKTGHIINISSTAGLAPIPGLSLYSASKYAVRAFTLAAALEHADSGVALTCVCPDAIKTPMLDKQVDFPEAAMTFSGNREMDVEEIGEYLLSSVLDRRPVLCSYPMHRGLLARLGDLFPGLGKIIAPIVRSKGEKKRRAYEQKKER